MWETIKEFGRDILDGMKEIMIQVLEFFVVNTLSAIAYVFESIPTPDFMNDYSLSDYIHADVSYFLVMSSFDTCLGIIAAAYLFRLIRRVLTLGIW